MRRMMFFVVAVLGISFAVIGMFNTDDVAFHYVLGQKELPLVVVMLVCFVSGAFLALLFFGVKSLYWRRRARSAERQLADQYRKADKAEVKRDFEADRKVE